MSTAATEIPVLVDTSVWVEMLRQTAHPLKLHLENLIAMDRARICAAVVGELLQGATTPKDTEAAEALAESIPMLEAPEDAWMEAGRLGHRLRQKGVTVGLFDCYLAVLAGRHRCALLSLDKHFKWIAKGSSLILDTQPHH